MLKLVQTHSRNACAVACRSRSYVSLVLRAPTQRCREDDYFNFQRNEWMVKEDLTPPDTIVAHSLQHTAPIPAEQLSKGFDIGEGVCLGHVLLCSLCQWPRWTSATSAFARSPRRRGMCVSARPMRTNHAPQRAVSAVQAAAGQAVQALQVVPAQPGQARAEPIVHQVQDAVLRIVCGHVLCTCADRCCSAYVPQVTIARKPVLQLGQVRMRSCAPECSDACRHPRWCWSCPIPWTCL